MQKEEIMDRNKIVTNIWFTAGGGKVSKVIEYYKKIFGKDLQEGYIIPLGETPSGNAEMCEVYIFRQKYIFMSTANEHHPLNDAISLIINCENQNEIDKYWNYFTQEGEESQCGWCIDKYGLRWQVLPENLAELMSKPNSFEIMMKQKKIVIAEYLK
jgi:predicted 3-demethylubiquinone-9 3-methyltransferase (glyoxalase superfamily)